MFRRARVASAVAGNYSAICIAPAFLFPAPFAFETRHHLLIAAMHFSKMISRAVQWLVELSLH